MESTSNYNMRFILRQYPDNPNESKIFARIMIDRKRTEINTGQTVHADNWDPQKQSVVGSRDLMNRINPHLEEMRYKLKDCYHQLKLQGVFITGDSIKKIYQGETIPYSSLMALFEYHDKTTKETLKYGTLKNYGSTEKYIRAFLQKKYKSKDIPLNHLNYEFITQFELFLRQTEPLQKSNTLTNNGIMKHMERLRKITTMGFKMDWLQKDPFIRYKLKFHRTEREFLIQSEIDTIAVEDLPTKLGRARDIFLFSCYTGLAYIDLANLSADNIVMGIDGELWLRTSRQKTETKVNVPLLPPALALLEKYKTDKKLIAKNRVLPFMSNQKVNKYLKQISDTCSINKNMTFHLARHTFATTVTLNNGIPIESVSKMLGHTKLSTTQVYVHVLDKKISDDMKGLRNKFKVKDDVNTMAV